MFSYYGLSRRLAKQLRDVRTDAEYWQKRALYLEKKLDERSDMFIEREFKLVDRFLTSQVKTFAITDEIKASKVTEQDVHDDELATFLAEKREFLVQCAKEAGIDDPEAVAKADFNANVDSYILQFEQGT